jgi:hypothetical protein
MNQWTIIGYDTFAGDWYVLEKGLESEAEAQAAQEDILKESSEPNHRPSRKVGKESRIAFTWLLQIGAFGVSCQMEPLLRQN